MVALHSIHLLLIQLIRQCKYLLYPAMTEGCRFTCVWRTSVVAPMHCVVSLTAKLFSRRIPAITEAIDDALAFHQYMQTA